MTGKFVIENDQRIFPPVGHSPPGAISSRDKGALSFHPNAHVQVAAMTSRIFTLLAEQAMMWIEWLRKKVDRQSFIHFEL